MKASNTRTQPEEVLEPLSVAFGRSVNQTRFELLLKQFYGLSRLPTQTDVVFDFTFVEWCETFPLSLLVLWISELLEGNKKLVFIPPYPYLILPGEIRGTEKSTDKRVRNEKRIAAYSYLHEVKFIDFLIKNECLTQKEIDGYPLDRREKSIESRISPFIFFAVAEDFEDFMSRIRKQYAMHFGPVLNIDVVKKGEIRDVVLKELGDNIFDHGSGRFGHMIMTLIGPIEHGLEKNQMIAARSKRAPIIEQSFFRSLGDSGYLTLVVSDKGPGIRTRDLREEYSRDRIIHSKKAKPDEYDIIDYAFLQHSTSKGHEKRMGILYELLQWHALTDTIPATGLFWVKEVVQAYKGFLLIRSGKSFVAYDFLSYPERGHPEGSLLTNKKDKSLRSLAAFGGTQIRIYFPTSHAIGTKKPAVLFPDQLPDPIDRREYAYFPLAVTSDVLIDDFQLRDWLQSHLTKLQRLKLAPGSPKTVVLDGTGWEVAGEKALKALFLLIVEVMRMQDHRFSAVFVNGKGVIELIGTHLTQVANKGSGIPKEKAFLSFDDNFTMSIFGLSDTETRALAELLYSANEGQAYVGRVFSETFLKKIRHLVNIRAVTDRFRPLFSITKIRETVKESIRQRLSDVILDPTNKIYYAQGCFLIPSGAYSEGYFEVRRIHENVLWQNDLLNWLRFNLDILRPSNVVTIGKSQRLYGDALAKLLPGIRHINVSNPKNPRESVKLALLPQGDKTVILTNVIGTQRSLDEILSFCTTLDVQSVFAVVDARSSGEADNIRSEGKAYKLHSVVKKPIQFWFEDKPPGFMYEQIIRVDPLTNVPVTDPFSFSDPSVWEHPIWMGLDESNGRNEFLEKVIRDTNGIAIGHFDSNGRHILYLFLTSLIAERFGSEIAEVIVKDIENYKGIDPNVDLNRVSHIFFPRNTPAAKEIARQISIALPASCKVIALSPQEIKYPSAYLATERTENAIVFDDASASGYSVRQMMEVADRCNAKSIFIYLLSNRAERSVSRSIQKIQKYGGATVHVRFLSEFPIPTFSPSDCPVCKTIARLERLKKELKGIEGLTLAVENEIGFLQKQPIALVLRSDTLPLFVSTPLDERINQTDMRARLELAKSLLSVRKLLVDTVKLHGSKPQRVLLFFSALAKEELNLIEDPITFNEVFYRKFRVAILQACQYFIGKISDLTQQEALSVISVLRIFDADLLLDLSAGIDPLRIDKELLMRMIIQFLLSDDIRLRAPYVTTILRRWEASTQYGELRSAVRFWEEMPDHQRESQDILKIYRQTCENLGDSKECANYFAYLNYKEFASHELETAVTLVNKSWRDISVLLKDTIIPDLRDIATAEISRVISQDLQKQTAAVNSLTLRADELAETILRHDKDAEVRATASNGFHVAINELHSLLLENDENTIPRSLKSFRTELGRVIRRVISQRAMEFEELRIKLHVSVPDDALLIFGYEVDIYSIVDAFVENIVKRAFRGVTDDWNKQAEIRVAEQSTEGKILLSISDSGVGLDEPFKHGVGLTKVNVLTRRIRSKWAIDSTEENLYRTRATVEFRDISELELW